MECAADSQEIRSKFGYFFTRGVDTRPEALASVSIGNRLTPASQIRIAILKLMAKRYTDSNPDGKAKVISYEARPMLRITPPTSSSDSRVKNFTFIDAVKRLPVNFTPSELRPILLKAGNRFSGRLRSLFVVLDDDAKVSRPSRTTSGHADGSGQVDAGDDESEVIEVQRAERNSGSGRGRKRGPDTQAASRAKH